MEQKEELLSPHLLKEFRKKKSAIPLLQMQSTVKTGQFMNCGTRTANGSSAAGNVHWASELPYKYPRHMQMK